MLRQQPPALRPLFSLHSWLGGRAGTLVWMPRPLGMDTVEVRPPSARHGRAHAPEAAGARVSVSMGRTTASGVTAHGVGRTVSTAVSSRFGRFFRRGTPDAPTDFAMKALRWFTDLL